MLKISVELNYYTWKNVQWMDKKTEFITKWHFFLFYTRLQSCDLFVILKMESFINSPMWKNIVDCDFTEMFTKHTRHSCLNIFEAGMLQNLIKEKYHVIKWWHRPVSTDEAEQLVMVSQYVQTAAYAVIHKFLMMKSVSIWNM